ncbi:hypothetical protein VTK73DRAFT_3544 [Phialemonium thermophilum]|uniref:Uncharacterized protein n=1 Tax=Phialemonium thermophilum TaxID=223376 RepID=A0ABR3Y0P8_9PEZI
MTNLSARFSMLREQDDPNTKIGKASDDSVLAPKRQSRLAEFGFGGLSDIAEVESIRARPSFSRVESFVSDDADSAKGSSMMNRSKPIEGNVLFGGRQKIYKIPVGGAAKSGSGGMVGKALYEDDVALSAFQLWRQAEKQRRSLDAENGQQEESQLQEEGGASRSVSPVPVGYDRKRETSSTMSSASAAARNSSAATSVTSQPTPSLKDWQPTAGAPSASTPALERNVTRTRRLYEQAISQDLHEQQSSALSRIDTLSRQRTLGIRTPDPNQSSASPTTYNFDRFGERRPILAKASAPNLRSISPPGTGPPVGMSDWLARAPGVAEPKDGFGGSPPLSPPVSEPGDHPLLPIQPNDRGKATALGVFQKPAQPYDESKYAQRQLQLQHSQETPTRRVRAESSAANTTSNRSVSSSTTQREIDEKTNDSTSSENASRPKKAAPTTFYEDSDESGETVPPKTTPQPAQRPPDMDHPAFRRSAMPIPLSMSTKVSGEPSPISEQAGPSTTTSYQPSPADSPTLGPTAGLSGIVRQHLRSESNSSSVYDVPETVNLDHDSPNRTEELKLSIELEEKRTNPWGSSRNAWSSSFLADQEQDEVIRTQNGAPEDEEVQQSNDQNILGLEAGNEAEEFANQLANARRRIRERLTTYADSDSSRAPSPVSHPDSSKDGQNQSTPQSNPLGLSILKSKSSRGSLIDRTRSTANSQTKAMKVMGLGATTMSTSPNSARKTSVDTDSSPSAAAGEDSREVRDTAARAGSDHDDETNAIHPGLRAFRQARRELQKHKELETLARHQAAQTSSPPSGKAEDHAEHGSPAREQVDGSRTPSSERRPPPGFPRPRAPSEESWTGTARYVESTMRQSPGERYRSGSETSNGGFRGGRLPALRNENSFDDAPNQLKPTNSAPQPPKLRSPGLPGTDIRHSPIMPPQARIGPNTPSPMPSPNYLQGETADRAGAVSNQPSPSFQMHSPMSHPPSPFSNGHQNSAEAAGTLNESMKRVVRKNDISEPSFIMSTSRVPTVSLPSPVEPNDVSSSGGGARSRSNSSAQNPPPVPPINPRRKWDGSRTRGVLGSLIGRREGGDETQASASMPHLPLSASVQSRVSDFSANDHEAVHERGRRPPRPPVMSEFGGTLGSSMHSGATSPFLATGPPASRTVVTPRVKASPTVGSMPGGMI